MRKNVAIVVRAVTTTLARNTSISDISLLNYPPISPLDEHHTSPDDKDAWERRLGRLVDFRLLSFEDRYPYRSAEDMTYLSTTLPSPSSSITTSSATSDR